MTSLLNISRLVLFLLATVVSVTGPAMASEEPAIKMPVDGACENSHILLEGVCLPPNALLGDPVALLENINALKKSLRRQGWRSHIR